MKKTRNSPDNNREYTAVTETKIKRIIPARFESIVWAAGPWGTPLAGVLQSWSGALRVTPGWAACSWGLYGGWGGVGSHAKANPHTHGVPYGFLTPTPHPKTRGD